MSTTLRIALNPVKYSVEHPAAEVSMDDEGSVESIRLVLEDGTLVSAQMLSRQDIARITRDAFELWLWLNSHGPATETIDLG